MSGLYCGKVDPRRPIACEPHTHTRWALKRISYYNDVVIICVRLVFCSKDNPRRPTACKSHARRGVAHTLVGGVGQNCVYIRDGSYGVGVLYVVSHLSRIFRLLRKYDFGHLTNLQPQAPQSPPEALPSPLEPPRGTPSPLEHSMITCLLLPQPRRWCL